MPYESLLTFRVKKILMICSNYDAFILEEDGQIESEVYKEYIDLNLTDPPRFVWTDSSDAARLVLDKRKDIDMIICMFNEHDKHIFSLAADLKSKGIDIPFVLLIHYSREIKKKISKQYNSSVDFIFSWHGNPELILAIVKLYEDSHNADNDILKVGVQAILLVEDSVRYYSTYLPELYKLVLTQSNEFLKETLNAEQKRNRKRSRPKILLATCYEEALSIFEKYKSNILGVISDVGMIVHKGDPSSAEKLDAGIDFVHRIKNVDPLMPVLLQSSQGSVAAIAKSLGVGFLRKYSRTLFLQLSDYMKEEFGFGDFVFRDKKGAEYGRAVNLHELEKLISKVPDDILVSKTSRNMFSKWFYARGLFTLASRFKAVHHIVASDARNFITEQINIYHDLCGRGIIAQFERDSYEDYIWFSRVGQSSMGGKARGLAFLNSLVKKYDLAASYDNMRISTPRSIVITTEYFDQFILENGLQYVIDSELSDSEILSEFVASRLPEELIEDLKIYLSTVDSPLAVRSSSKLEDSNYQPFAGVYSTYMVPVTENKDQMLRMLDKAIKSVYASVFYNGSRLYIQTTENLLSEEKMAVIIQTICGSEHNGLYYPLVSGVARSVNFYPLGEEKSGEGIVNLAFGLGKTIVEGGKSLRFSPKHPRKILQLSDTGLARKDTQKMMYALDLRPSAFKISRNEGVNLVNIPVNEAIKYFDYPSYVVSSYDYQNDRIKPGYSGIGSIVVSFDTIVKYGKFPLVKALGDILKICRKELASEIEMEFAADVIPESEGNRIVLKLLQVRPIREFMNEDSNVYGNVASDMKNVLVRSDKALGAGYISNIDNFVLVTPDKFDNTETAAIAEEIGKINSDMRARGEGYILIGPGRWGSSDRFLGIPVTWSDISEAKVIIENSLPGYEVEPSQGTHFFQNITSLGVGYLSVSRQAGNGFVDFDSLYSLEPVQEGRFTKVFKAPSSLVAFIDRNTNKAIIGY
jgi:hypothetical protein